MSLFVHPLPGMEDADEMEGGEDGGGDGDEVGGDGGGGDAALDILLSFVEEEGDDPFLHNIVDY